MRCTIPKPALHLALLLLAWPTLGGHGVAQQDETPEFPSDRVDGPAVQFGDDVYTRDQFGAWLLREFGAQRMREFAFVHEIERRAGELGADMSRAPDVAAAQEDFDVRIANAFRGDRDGWLAELERLGHTEEGVYAMRVAEERHMRLSEFVARAQWQVKEHHVVREWQRRYGPGGRGVTFRALHLRFVPPQMPPATPLLEQTKILEKARAEHLEVAKTVRAQITSLADFPAAVAKYSEHEASKANGGLWPNILLADEWPDENVAALLDLPAGTITDPIVGKGGLWIFAIENVVVTGLDDVKEQLAQELLERGPIEMDRAEFLDAEQRKLAVQYDDVAIDRDPLTALRTGSVLVDGREVPLAEYARWLIDTQGETHLELFASRVAVSNLADERGVEIAPEELQARVDRELVWMLENTFQGKKDRWRLQLAALGIDEALWRRLAARRIQPSLVAEKMIVADRVVTDELVRDLYVERYGESGERIDVRQIVVNLGIEPRGELETQQEWSDRALPVIQQLRPKLDEIAQRHADGEDFMALARKFSDDAASVANGGRPVGGFDVSVLPASIAVEIQRLKIGELSGPQVFDTRIVFYEVVAREKVDYESVKDALAAEVRTRQPSSVEVALFFNGLVRKSPPKVLPGMWR
jgi:parvulin-like peptidyl-prolyl isomerase